MKKFTLFVLISLSLNAIKANAQTWVDVGIPDFSAEAHYTNIAIDTSGTPYVVYQDAANSYKATVKKYNGSSWVTVGSPGFSAGQANYTTIVVDRSGTPYVAYQDNSNHSKATVVKYNGTAWVSVGAPGADTTARYTSIAIDSSGTLYMAYQDFSTPQAGITVFKYSHYTGWTSLGTEFSVAQAFYTSIAIDRSGTPYVVYEDVPAFSFDGPATVMKFYAGVVWVTVGTAGFSSPSSGSTSIAINNSGIPYIAYQDGGDSGLVTVMKLDSNLSPISGSGSLCIGGTATLSDTTSGATWSSSNTSIATIGTSTGTVTGIGAGTTTISYTTSGGVATFTVTVIPLPSAGTISGALTVCISSTTSLSDGITGGIWSSGTTIIATVGSTGIVSGVSAGTATISYSVTNSCGSAIATKIATVNPLPYAGSITGTAVVCAGSATSLSNTVTGGIWGSGNTAIATIGSTGMVNGISAGTATISYSVTNSCGTAIATQIQTVNPLPNAGSITGASSICTDSSIVLTDGTAGGVWSSSDTTIAAVGSTGVVDGISSGSVTISYSVTNSCGTVSTTETVTVNSCTAGISGIPTPTEDITIYPNPTKNNITVASFTPINSIAISNLIGQNVYSGSFNKNMAVVSLGQLPDGVYIVKINGSKVYKVVKE